MSFNALPTAGAGSVPSEAVRNDLVTAGQIEGNRLTAVGSGEMRPLEHESNSLELNASEARANMRVEMSIAGNPSR